MWLNACVFVFMIVCPFGNECWYSWLCARLGICVYALMLNLWCAFIWFVINIWFAVDVYVERTTRGKDSSWRSHLFVLIWDHMICEKYMICQLMCMSMRTTRGEDWATCWYWIVLIWFVMNIWREYCTVFDSYDLW